MDAADVAAALTSAVLHAGWNAAVKASRDPPRAMTAQMLLSAVLVLPGLLWSGLAMDRRVDPDERRHRRGVAARL
jgi:hypothetical protein